MTEIRSGKFARPAELPAEAARLVQHMKDDPNADWVQTADWLVLAVVDGDKRQSYIVAKPFLEVEA